MSEIQDLKRLAQEAISGHKRAVEGLYVGDIPKYPEERMAEMRRRFDSERDRVFRNIEARAREIYQEASSAAEVAGEVAADSVLGTSERSAAAERLALVEADVGGMTGPQLQSRLEGVLANGTRTEQFCYYQAARKKDRQDKRRREQDALVRGDFHGAAQSIGPLDHILGRLEEHLIGPERARRQEQVAGRLKEADEVMGICYLGRHGAKSVGEAYANQHWYRPPGGWPRERAGISAGGHGTAARPVPSE